MKKLIAAYLAGFSAGKTGKDLAGLFPGYLPGDARRNWWMIGFRDARDGKRRRPHGPS